MARFDLRLSADEKEKLREIARYYGFSITDLIKNWIRYDIDGNVMEHVKNQDDNKH